MAGVRIRFVARGRGVPSPARRFIVGSLVAHVVLAVALIWIPELRRGPRVPANATIVELVGGLPGPRPQAPSAPQAQPAPPTPPPAPKGPSLQKPPEKKPQEPKVKKPAEPKPTAAPAAAASTPETAASPQPSAAADAAGAGEAGSAASGASVSTIGLGDPAFGWYRGAVANALYGAWKRPILSGLTDSVEVRVAFEIMRDGNVRGLRVEESSGVPVLDRSALRAVSDASPLPALPASLREPYLPASIVFRLYPEGGPG